ncbi:hypothetical protein [Paenibacillus typhae]|uniref:hypothetical protein n=1 Tax=Paenibacillus typhae TaxID=1174501 RepID=UPI001C8E27A7|nr:hypothetical protein [Paenibacillus typhae]MBY0009166.1 hypothetical protein [Paenibacillus typhae]
MLNIRDINKVMKGNIFNIFFVDKGEKIGDDLQLIVSMYKCESGAVTDKLHSWQIICKDVRESNIKYASGFTYLRILKDHPVLFKYNKPSFMIFGPIQLQGDDEIYGQVFRGLEEFLGTYNARDRIIDFMPFGGTTEGLVSFTIGPQEIADVYRSVLASRGLEITLWPDPQIYSDNGTERILLFNNSAYVIAEKFHITQIDIT